MRIYLDVCCWNRPFDDLGIGRNRLEAEAVLEVLRLAGLRQWEIVVSDIVHAELSVMPSADRQAKVARLMSCARTRFVASDTEYARAAVLITRGLKAVDALHVACAESAGCGLFLTADDALHANCRSKEDIMVRVVNPLQWIAEVALQ